MKVTEIVLGEDHPGIDEVDYLLDGMVRSLVLIGQGTIVGLMEDAGVTDTQATMLVNQMFSHFAQSTSKPRNSA